MTVTFEQFKSDMIDYARNLQKENYAGDKYYAQDCWLDAFEEGTSPEDAVLADMEYWDLA